MLRQVTNRAWLACLAMLVLAPGSSVAVAEPSAPVFWAESSSPQAEHIRQTLGQPLADPGFVFQEAPLAEVVDILRREYGLEVQLDLPALDSLGISPDDPVSVRMQRGSLGTALRLMLKQLDLTYVIDDEVLLITTEEEALSRLTVAVYPVGDLLAVKQQDSPDPGTPEAEPGRMPSLIETITSCVASDTWVSNGGAEADIQVLQPGLLVVSQTEDVHSQLRGLLDALRNARQHEFAVPHTEMPRTEGEAHGNRGGGYF